LELCMYLAVRSIEVYLTALKGVQKLICQELWVYTQRVGLRACSLGVAVRVCAPKI
jgi:hypothetical protein